MYKKIKILIGPTELVLIVYVNIINYNKTLNMILYFIIFGIYFHPPTDFRHIA